MQASRAGSGAHTECLYAWSVTNLTLKRNHFYHCAVMDVFITGSNAASGGYIENNIFEKPWENTGVISNSAYAFHFRNGGSPSPDPSNWDFRYNTFVGAAQHRHEREPGRSGRNAGDRQRLPLRDARAASATPPSPTTRSSPALAARARMTNSLSTYLGGFTGTGDPGMYSLLSGQRPARPEATPATTPARTGPVTRATAEQHPTSARMRERNDKTLVRCFTEAVLSSIMIERGGSGEPIVGTATGAQPHDGCERAGSSIRGADTRRGSRRGRTAVRRARLPGHEPRGDRPGGRPVTWYAGLLLRLEATALRRGPRPHPDPRPGDPRGCEHAPGRELAGAGAPGGDRRSTPRRAHGRPDARTADPVGDTRGPRSDPRRDRRAGAFLRRADPAPRPQRAGSASSTRRPPPSS